MSVEIIVEDLAALGIANAAISSMDGDTLRVHCKRAWQEVEAALRTAGYPLPLPAEAMAEAIPLRGAGCNLAAWYLLTVRGFDPTSEADAAVRTTFEDARAYLRDVAAKKIIPFPLNADGNPIGTDPTEIGDAASNEYAITSDTRRGW